MRGEGWVVRNSEEAATDSSNACIRNTTTELVLIIGIDKSTAPLYPGRGGAGHSDRRLGRSWAQEGETACGVWGVGHLPQLLQLTMWRVVIRRLSCLPKSQSHVVPLIFEWPRGHCASG